jgi:diguanylate cyclase (GGDEF)-like protein/PAS domain S-box-containing protein
MRPKPSYEELEKRVDALARELASFRNLQHHLHQAGETARALLNATTDSAILIDIQGNILAINEIAAKLLSKNNVDLLRRNFLDMLPPDLARQRKARFDQVIANGDPLEFEDDCNGSVFSNSLYPLFDRQGKIQSLAFFSRDITGNRQIERALKESELIFSSISAAAHDAFIMMDGQGMISYWNSAAERVFGYTAEEIIGRDLHKLLAPKKDYNIFKRKFKSFKKTGKGKGIGRTLEFIALRKDQTEFPIELSLSAIKMQDEWHSFGIVRDISKRKQAEEQLRESERKYRELSITDDLTKLYNSRHFYERIQLEMQRTTRYHHPLSLLMIDIDDFKKFNDTHGHLAGDKALAKTGKVIQNALRDSDSGYRYGGEEFVVILPETSGPGAVQVAERIRKELAEMSIPLSEVGTCNITASIGVSELREREKSSEFIKRADRNLYAAKAAGKNRVIFI